MKLEILKYETKVDDEKEVIYLNKFETGMEKEPVYLNNKFITGLYKLNNMILLIDSILKVSYITGIALLNDTKLLIQYIQNDSYKQISIDLTDTVEMCTQKFRFLVHKDCNFTDTLFETNNTIKFKRGDKLSASMIGNYLFTKKNNIIVKIAGGKNKAWPRSAIFSAGIIEVDK